MEQIFKDNPKLDVAYKTTDGKFFFLENDARNHASNLENKKVIKVERAEENLTTDVENNQDIINEVHKEIENKVIELPNESNTVEVEPIIETQNPTQVEDTETKKTKSKSKK